VKVNDRTRQRTPQRAVLGENVWFVLANRPLILRVIHDGTSTITDFFLSLQEILGKHRLPQRSGVEPAAEHEELVMRLSKVLVGSAVVMSLLWLGACSNQGEGDACSIDSGNDDCQSGLVCTKASTFGSNSDLCCPPNLADATVAACRQRATNNAGSSGASGSSGSSGTAGGTSGTAGGAGDAGMAGASGDAGMAGSTSGSAGTAGGSGQSGTAGSGTAGTGTAGTGTAGTGTSGGSGMSGTSGMSGMSGMSGGAGTGTAGMAGASAGAAGMGTAGAAG
jgi:hypothetical protein